MTELLEHAIKTVKALSASKQDAVADVILAWAHSFDETDEIPSDHKEAVKEGLAQLDRGEFYTESQMRDLLKSF